MDPSDHEFIHRRTQYGVAADVSRRMPPNRHQIATDGNRRLTSELRRLPAGGHLRLPRPGPMAPAQPDHQRATPCPPSLEGFKPFPLVPITILFCVFCMLCGPIRGHRPRSAGPHPGTLRPRIVDSSVNPLCVLCVFCGLSNSVAADVSRRIQAGQAPTQVGQSPSICVFRVLCGHSTP